MIGNIHCTNQPCIDEQLRHAQEQRETVKKLIIKRILFGISSDKRTERSLVQINTVAKKVSKSPGDIGDVPGVSTIIEVSYANSMVMPIEVIKLEIEVD